MTHRAMKLAMALAASASALLMGCEPPSTTVAVDFTVDVSGVVRPSGSGIAIVGDAFSLGATAEKRDGDPAHGLKLQLQPDGTYRGSAWLPSDQHVHYVVYMTNPFAPQIDTPGGMPAVKEVDFTRAQSGTGEGEVVTVTMFDVPQNITKPCVDFSVYVPPNTPSGDPVYIAGNDDQMGPWLPGHLALGGGAGGVYTAHLCFDQGKELQYKYVRSNGDWTKVEKNADGSERNNRTLTVTEDVSRTDTVEKWADL